MLKVPTVNQFEAILRKCNSVVQGEIFVYKSGKIGQAYVDKERIPDLGAPVMNSCLRGMTQNAIDNGLTFSNDVSTVAVVGPAYGAINYPPIVAEYLSQYFPWIKFIATRTQLDNNGKHIIPEKLFPFYEQADCILLTEDITNDGTTFNEVGILIKKLFRKCVSDGLCLVDRNKNTTETLGIKNFFPFFSVKMDMIDPRVDPSLLNSGLKLNITLGKGKLWVAEFGYPPYPEGMDFSGFSLFK